MGSWGYWEFHGHLCYICCYNIHGLLLWVGDYAFRVMCTFVARETKSQEPLLPCYQWSQVSQRSGVQRLESSPSTDTIRFSGVAGSSVMARGSGFQATPLLFPYFTPPVFVPGDPLLYKQICEIIWYLAEVSLQSCGCFTHYRLNRRNKWNVSLYNDPDVTLHS